MLTTSPTRTLLSEFARLLKPPPKLTLSEWVEQNVVLWDGPNAGEKFRPWAYQREMLDAMADPSIERVSIIKPARIGYTKGLIAALAAKSATAPCPMILLVPTDDDARGFAVDEVDPAFRASPALRSLIRQGRLDGRNTLTMRSLLGGGSIKILAARSPRNLRRHDAKVLFQDEIDAMEVTAEGDPLALAEKRTLAHADRKIISGSTPTVEGVSNIERLYDQSDQRIFEVPCPECGDATEILWAHIVWPQGEPVKAAFACPHCGSVVEERHKAAMVAKGQWKITRPEVRGHAGFRINALVSLFANASWAKLAAEYLQAKKDGPAALQVFVNTVLGRTWRTSAEQVTPSALMERVEPFGCFRDPPIIPAEVLATTCGVDCQGDRLEATIVGWPREGAPFVLGHHVVYGSPLLDTTWEELDAFLETKWRHPTGWLLGIDGTAIDSGGIPGLTPKVYAFCAARVARRIFAIKGGHAGQTLRWKPAKQAKGGAPLFLVATDALKSEIMQRLGQPSIEDGESNPQSLRLSDSLTDTWFDQATGERRFIRYPGNNTVVEWKKVKPGQAVEALDCLVYAFAVKESASFKAISMVQRAEWRQGDEIRKPAQPVQRRVVRSGYMM